MSNFPRVVQAALAETKSKFALAEALATEIPERPVGQGAKGQRVDDLLAIAAQEIAEAGGDARSVGTLDNYRKVALWVGRNGTQASRFPWVPGVSLTAHLEAMQRGMAYADLAANPKKVRDIRMETGGASKDGDPTRVVAGWSSSQRAEAAKALLAEPEVAEEAIRDISTHASVASAQRRVAQRMEEEVETNRSQTSRNIKNASDRLSAGADLSHAVVRMKNAVEGYNRGGIPEDQAGHVIRDATRVKQYAEWLIQSAESGSVSIDEGLAALLAGGQ